MTKGEMMTFMQNDAGTNGCNCFFAIRDTSPYVCPENDPGDEGYSGSDASDKNERVQYAERQH